VPYSWHAHSTRRQRCRACPCGAGLVTRALTAPGQDQRTGLVRTTAQNFGTQLLVAGSDPVLSHAARKLGLRPLELRDSLQITRKAPGVIAITARAATAREALREARAVAASYQAYVSA
jgi:hypothetical protein